MAKYYLGLLLRASRDTLEFFDLKELRSWIRLLAPPLLGFLFKWIVSGIGVAVADILKSPLVVYGLSTLGWICIIFFVGLIFSPVRLGKEKQGTLDSLNVKLNKLEEERKPKLEIRIVHGQLPYQEFNPFPSDAERGPELICRVQVFNPSTSTAIDGVVIKMDISPKVRSLKFRQNFSNLKIHAAGSVNLGECWPGAVWECFCRPPGNAAPE